MSSSFLPTTILTTQSLIASFSTSLTSPSASPPSSASSNTSSSPNSPPPLSILSTVTTALKNLSAKLSLLLLTPPYTPRAIAPLFHTLNTSLLPSLIAATQLICPEQCTAAFTAEACTQTRGLLKDLAALVALAGPAQQPSLSPDEIKQAVGRVWSSCDSLTALAKGGVQGFVVEKAQGWLELVNDAVMEISEWEPDGDNDDDIFDDIEQNENDEDQPAGKGQLEDTRIARDEALRNLKDVPTSLEFVVKRLAATTVSPNPDQLPRREVVWLDKVVEKFRLTSESVDEVAEALYGGQFGKSAEVVNRVERLIGELMMEQPDNGQGPEL